MRDRKLQLAVERAVEIIGEAAARVGDDTRAKHRNLPWGDIIGMRNRLIHTYFDVDLSLLWTTVSDDLPVLIGELDAILGRQGGT